MKTSENNAKRMLTKAVAFPFGAGCRCAVNLLMCRLSAVMLMCTSLVACGYLAPDKARPHASVFASETVTTTPNASNSGMRNMRGEAPVTQSISTYSLAAPSQAEPSVHGVSATSGGVSEKLPEPSLHRVIGDATVFLPSLIDDTLASADDHAARSSASASSMQPVEAAAFDEGKNRIWLLAIIALIAVGGAGLDRYRKWRVTTRRRQKADYGNGLPSISAPAMVADDETVGAGIGPVQFSCLHWHYQSGKFDAPEQWAVESPVDFLPLSLAEKAMHEADEARLVADAAANEEMPVHEQNASTQLPALTASDDSLSQLLDQLERIALRESDDIPALLIERGNDLPEVICTTGEPVSHEVLQAWESMLRQAIPDAQSLTLPWLLVSILLLRADDASHRDAEVLYAEAEEWIGLSMTADHERTATWQARMIDIDLRRAKRQKGAARLLSLRTMQSEYVQQIAQGEPPPLFAWIDVLMFWAQCQFGDAAVARYNEAESICLRLSGVPASADAAQRRRAELLRQRAAIEQGGPRLSSLDTAQALVDALYERMPSADNALAVAVTALARGNVLPPEQAKEAYSRALMHAFMAEGEPRLRAESLQCRLAVQWAYESLPGMAVQSGGAIALAGRLEAMHIRHPDTLQRMAQTYLRHADFARTCELCENAWRKGCATPALIAIWQEACRQWKTTSALPQQLAARQQTMRQLSIASAMC